MSNTVGPNTGYYNAVEVETLRTDNVAVSSTYTASNIIQTETLQLKDGVQLVEATGSTEYTLTLPATDATPGQYLTSLGGGMLNWTAPITNLSANDVEPTATRTYLTTGTQTITAQKTFTSPPVMPGATVSLKLATNPEQGYITCTSPTVVMSASTNVFQYSLYQRFNFTTYVSNNTYLWLRSANSTNPAFSTALVSQLGTTNGTGNFIFLANTFNLTDSNARLHIDGVQIPHPTSLNFTVSVTAGTAAANKIMLLDASSNISGIASLSCDVLKARGLPILTILTSSAATLNVSTASVYRIQPTSNACSLVLTNTLANGRLIYIIRETLSTTHALTIDASTNSVILNGVLGGNISTTAALARYTLLKTNNEYILL